MAQTDANGKLVPQQGIWRVCSKSDQYTSEIVDQKKENLTHDNRDDELGLYNNTPNSSKEPSIGSSLLA